MAAFTRPRLSVSLCVRRRYTFPVNERRCFRCRETASRFAGRDSNGVELWLCRLCGHEQKGVQCPHCCTFSVLLVAHTTEGTEVWRCERCGESKHWCPACNQGWVLPRGVQGYMCDECDSAWPRHKDISRSAIN